MSIDFVAGCLGGIAGVLVGHPLDTIKVHLQTQSSKNPIYHGTWHCLKTIAGREKLIGLYRGITSPLAGIGIVNAIVFGIYGNVQRHTKYPDSLESHFYAGSTAGLFQSVVSAPMELAKTRLQLQSKMSTGIKFNCPWDCLKHIYLTEGVRGTYRGLSITAMRDVPGFASYFVSYEYLMRLPSHPNALYSLLAGGFAGICSWLACYPVDVIKTCLQADGMGNTPPVYKGIIDCAQKNYATDGIRFFFRGICSTLIRAFPMNAATFFVVSFIMRMTNSNVDVAVRSTESTVGIVSIERSPLYHLHKNEDMNRKRFLMVRNLKASCVFNEAVCNSEVEELVNELYPIDNDYYRFEDELIKNFRVENIGDVC